MGFENVGKVWDGAAFREYVQTVDFRWCEGITLHHTGVPDLAMRPQGFTVQHMRNLAHYYGNQRGWSAGPHLFIDDDQIFGLSPLDARGVHAASFNATHIGIEVLGNYNAVDDPKSGRGLACWETAAECVAILLARLGFDFGAVNFHRDDPKTSKTCPGTSISREWVENLVADAAEAGGSDRIEPPTPVEMADKEIRERLDAIEWQVAQLRKLLL